MKRARGRPATIGHGSRARGLRTFDLDNEGKQNARLLREFIPSRLPNDDGYMRDVILSVAYGCGGWRTANALLDNPPDRMTADDRTIERLNAIRRNLEAQGYDYATVRAGLLQTEGE